MAGNQANSSSKELPLLLPPPPGFEAKGKKPLNPEPPSIIIPKPPRTSSLCVRYFDGPKFGLPDKWLIERRPRTSAKYLGKMDQFFYEPNKGRQFRSLKSVEQCLGKELPEVRKLMKSLHSRDVMAPPHLGAPLKRGPTSKREATSTLAAHLKLVDSPAIPIQIDDDDDNLHPPPQLMEVPIQTSKDHQQFQLVDVPMQNSISWPPKFKSYTEKKMNYVFDFANPPVSVTWALTNPRKDIWSPKIDGKRISVGDRNYWADTFRAINIAKTYASTSKVSQDTIVVEKKENKKTGIELKGRLKLQIF